MLRKVSIVLGVLAGLCLLTLIGVMIAQPPGGELTEETRTKKENMTLEEEFEEYKESGGKGLVPYYKERLNETNGTSEKDAAAENTTTEEQTPRDPPEEGTMEYVRIKSRHNNTCLTVIEGNIYNLSGWMSENPEHATHVQNFCGAIATDAYESERAKGFIPEIPLDEYLVGELQENYTRLP